MMKRALLLVLVLSLCGCTHLTAQHLQRAPLLAERQHPVAMRHVTFDYTATPIDREIGIIGTVRITRASLPAWVTFVSQYSISAYICDTAGNVLASHDVDLIPRPLEDALNIPFEMRVPLGFKPDAQPLQIAFGYRLIATPEPGTQGGAGAPRAFVATENAIQE